MSADPLWSDYYQYDRRVDIVSVAEVWFTKSAALTPSVRHFERFPKIPHPDGNEATPDFTVLFVDDTAVVGEVSNLALIEDSLDDLASQLFRYSALMQVPSGPRVGGVQPMQEVKEVDVLLFTPDNLANAACDRLAKAMDDDTHPYSPVRPPMVLSHSFDSGQGAYTFIRPQRAKNDRLPDYGRNPSLSTWLAEPLNADTLRGLPVHFAPVKAAARFMNDAPPPLYTATVIWSLLLPTYIGERGFEIPVDLAFTVDELTDRLRADFGFGRQRDVAAALEFLKTSRLCAETPTGWLIYFRDLGTIDREISQALAHEFRSIANKTRPVRTAQERAADDTTEPGSLFDPDS